ncbi:MAG: hemerythrin domain-containing protein [Elusimicrobiota bacterium]
MTPRQKAQDILTVLGSVEAEHRTLQSLLLRHQESLVGLDFSSALGVLEDFARRTCRHRRVEEDDLLPVYSKLSEVPPDGEPEIFLQEHREIEEQLDSLLTAARSISPSGDRRAVAVLVEQAARLRVAIEQHIRREEKTLLPALRAQLAPK